MLELLRFEFRRLSKSIFYRIVGVYCIVWPVIVVLLLRLILGLFMKDSGLNFADIGLDKGEIRYLNWLISVGFINDLPKFLALFICLHVGRDFTDGIVRNKITAGHSRTSIFFSQEELYWRMMEDRKLLLPVFMELAAYLADEIIGIFFPFCVPDKFGGSIFCL